MCRGKVLYIPSLLSLFFVILSDPQGDVPRGVDSGGGGGGDGGMHPPLDLRWGRWCVQSSPLGFSDEKKKIFGNWDWERDKHISSTYYL